MVLVFILFIIVISTIIILMSNIKINIQKLELSNEIENTPILKNIEISIELYVLNKIKIFKKHIDNTDIQNIKNSKKFEQLKNKFLKDVINKEEKQNVKFNFDVIKNLKPKLQEINLKLEIGTEDVLLTSFLIVIISIVISIILSKIIDKFDEKKYVYKIMPNYNSKNSIKIDLISIIDIKLVNIINILFRILLRSDKFDKRTSDRRTYDNSNEQYPRNDRCKYDYRGTN